MMACEQKQRPVQSCQMLPDVVSSEQQSLVLVKKLLAIAVSSITYLRGLFPEKAYGRKYVGELKVLILREHSCPGAQQIVQWLQGCFDALQKRYLRMVLLSIYCDPDNPQKVTECYQFKIKYTENGPQLDFESKNGQSLTKMACDNTQKSSMLLVRKLYMLMQNLGPLPDNICLNMKLFYYDDVTPQEYQPPGFKDDDSETLIFEREPVNLTMGEVVTPFHSLKMSVTTERMDSLVKKTADLKVEARKTRSGRIFEPQVGNALPMAHLRGEGEGSGVEFGPSNRTSFGRQGENKTRMDNFRSIYGTEFACMTQDGATVMSTLKSDFEI
ncbi:HORMA domain-containing 1 [Labeo rohita]|uniref:HORMA domain-containing 1 n=1 Tax=Labeo rohita TaxID=84645 RepID=A0A498NIQ0_LABRO|nr:HORMA domain-containing 1 [Labeo rohita]